MNQVSPVLTFVSEMLYSDTCLDEVLLIACQHLLEPNRELFEMLFTKGLKPENTYVIGKCYSTNREVAESLKERGVTVSKYSWTFDSLRSFDEQFIEYVSDFLAEVQQWTDIVKYKKVIILDDGGLLIERAAKILPSERVVAIEQTSSGYNRLQTAELPFCVVNVARSWAKLEIETPFIAGLIARQVKERITRYSIDDPRILVVGQGPVGSGLKESLGADYLVKGCDIIQGRCDFDGTFKSKLTQFNIIIGATGVQILSLEEVKRFDERTLLISASSSDREFPATNVRQRRRQTADSHLDLPFENSVIVNSGFPINFTGDAYSLPREEVQFTMGLLLSAVCQAIDTDAAQGFCDLDATKQYQIVQFFRSLGTL